MSKSSASKQKTKNISGGGIAIASAGVSVTREIADMLQIAPARAAASILLMIFETIEVHNLLTRVSTC